MQDYANVYKICEKLQDLSRYGLMDLVEQDAPARKTLQEECGLGASPK